MTLRERAGSLIFVAITMLLLVSCSSTSLMTEWHDKTYQGGQLNRFIVIGVINNSLYRRAYEDAIVEKFEANGLSAVASYTLMDDLINYDDQEKLERAVAKVSANGVVIAKVVEFDESEQYIPPSYDMMPSMGMGVGYYNSYHAAMSVSYRPGYVQKSTTIRVASEVFTTNPEKMIWAAETESFNPSSYQSVINKLADITLTSLKKEGFVK